MSKESKVSAEPIVLGALHGAYGLKGWVRIRPFQDTASLLASKNWFLIEREGQNHPIVVEDVKEHAGGLIAKIKGVDSPEKADALRGTVGLLRQDFPPTEEGTYYWVDLIGCQVTNRSSELIGIVSGLIDNGAHDVLEVKKADGAAVLIPFVESYILAVDVASKKITADWDLNWD